MIVVALAFYAVVGLFIAGAILNWLGLLPDKPKTGQPTPVVNPPVVKVPAMKPPATKSGAGVMVFILICMIGLPLGLAWLGGAFGYGNDVFPKSGGSGGAQSTGSYQPANGPVWVDGYYRQDGTYVPGHYRTRRDDDPSNNWSQSPNVNPYTGKPGTKH